MSLEFIENITVCRSLHMSCILVKTMTYVRQTVFRVRNWWWDIDIRILLFLNSFIIYLFRPGSYLRTSYRWNFSFSFIFLLISVVFSNMTFLSSYTSQYFLLPLSTSGGNLRSLIFLFIFCNLLGLKLLKTFVLKSGLNLQPSVSGSPITHSLGSLIPNENIL